MAKKLFFVVFILLITLLASFMLLSNNSTKTLSDFLPKSNAPTAKQTPGVTNTKDMDAPTVEVFSKNLDVPWALTFLPDGRLLTTERRGRVLLIQKNGTVNQTPLLQLSDVKQIGESGAHGIAIHPDFEKNSFVYVYYTYSTNRVNTLNRVTRYRLENNKLVQDKVIVDAIPGAQFHDGGRVKFGPDNFLYITTGDALEPSLAQDKNSLAGKILRVTDDGSPAPGNPFDTRIYSYGHRNPQGIAWNESGQLYETEHGSSTMDEVNMIKPGQNYGWPDIRGDQTRSGMQVPLLHSGNDTWAPAGAAIVNDVLYFGGLRGQALFFINLSSKPDHVSTAFKGEYGRIRDMVLGPDGLLYVTSSNRDGRGNPANDDDKILRVNPAKL